MLVRTRSKQQPMVRAARTYFRLQAHIRRQGNMVCRSLAEARDQVETNGRTAERQVTGLRAENAAQAETIRRLERQLREKDGEMKGAQRRAHTDEIALGSKVKAVTHAAGEAKGSWVETTAQLVNQLNELAGDEALNE